MGHERPGRTPATLVRCTETVMVASWVAVSDVRDALSVTPATVVGGVVASSARAGAVRRHADSAAAAAHAAIERGSRRIAGTAFRESLFAVNRLP